MGVYDTRVLWLDVADIQVESNVGIGRQADDELLASIDRFGILQPLLVVPRAKGKYGLISGHRRLDAARRLSLLDVPVLVFEPAQDSEEKFLAAQIVENTLRKNLTPFEEMQAYEQLLLVADVAKAAKLVCKPVEEMERLKAVCESKEARTSLAEGLTLFQAMDVAELEASGYLTERELSALMVRLADRPDYADYYLDEAKGEVDKARRVAETVQRLEGEGIKVLCGDDAPKRWERETDEFMELESLQGLDGEEMTVAEHAQCPGHTAIVDPPSPGIDECRVVYGCRNYKYYGHQLCSVGSGASSERARRLGLERAAQERFQEEAKLIRAQHRRFVINLLSGRELPVGFAPLILQVFDRRYIGGDDALELLPGEAESISEWVGGSPERALRAVAARAFLLLDQTGIDPSEGTRQYLQSLAALGYKLTPLESEIVSGTFVRISDRSDEELEREFA